jgi:predicted nucleic acid-binding protein
LASRSATSLSTAFAPTCSTECSTPARKLKPETAAIAERSGLPRERVFAAGCGVNILRAAGGARAAGAVRATLEQAGTPIGAYDTLLAGQAVRRGLVLVTANAAEFARVDGRIWQNWAE